MILPLNAAVSSSPVPLTFKRPTLSVFAVKVPPKPLSSKFKSNVPVTPTVLFKVMSLSAVIFKLLRFAEASTMLASIKTEPSLAAEPSPALMTLLLTTVLVKLIVVVSSTTLPSTTIMLASPFRFKVSPSIEIPSFSEPSAPNTPESTSLLSPKSACKVLPSFKLTIETAKLAPI